MDIEWLVAFEMLFYKNSSFFFKIINIMKEYEDNRFGENF